MRTLCCAGCPLRRGQGTWHDHSWGRGAMLATAAMRTAFIKAGEAARELGAAEITSGHLLLGFCTSAGEPSTAGHALAELGLTAPVVRTALPTGGHDPGRAQIPLSRELKELIEPALRLAG